MTSYYAISRLRAFEVLQHIQATKDFFLKQHGNIKETSQKDNAAGLHLLHLHFLATVTGVQNPSVTLNPKVRLQEAGCFFSSLQKGFVSKDCSNTGEPRQHQTWGRGMYITISSIRVEIVLLPVVVVLQTGTGRPKHYSNHLKTYFSCVQIC